MLAALKIKFTVKLTYTRMLNNNVASEVGTETDEQLFSDITKENTTER
jgi:hypothetical protein